MIYISKDEINWNLIWFKIFIILTTNRIDEWLKAFFFIWYKINIKLKLQILCFPIEKKKYKAENLVVYD